MNGAKGQYTKHFYEFGPFRLDATDHQLFREGVPLPLTPKALDALLILVQNGGVTLKKEELMNLHRFAGNHLDALDRTRCRSSREVRCRAYRGPGQTSQLCGLAGVADVDESGVRNIVWTWLRRRAMAAE